MREKKKKKICEGGDDYWAGSGLGFSDRDNEMVGDE